MTLIHKETGMKITIDSAWGKDSMLIDLIKSLGYVEFEFPLIYTFRIDGGKVTTDTQTFRKIVDLCINNGIRLEFVNGSINTDKTVSP